LTAILHDLSLLCNNKTLRIFICESMQYYSAQVKNIIVGEFAYWIVKILKISLHYYDIYSDRLIVESNIKGIGSAINGGTG
jgi:hypothetical protein